MPSRRTFIMAAGSVGTVGIAGCFGSNQADKALAIRNDHTTKHTVRVKAQGDFQPQAVEKTVPPGQEVVIQGFIPQLDYDHTATITVIVDGTQVTQVDRRVAFDLERFTVVVTGPENVRVEPTQTTTTAPDS